MTALALPAALLVGLILGTLGGGGAVLTLPALVHLLGMTPQQATTGSLVVVGTSSLIALVPHARRGKVRIGQGLTFGAVGTVGSIVGSAASTHLPATTLLMLFSALLLLIAALMIKRALAPREEHAPGEPGEPGEPAEPMLTLHPLTCQCPRVAKVVVTATVVGLLTGLLGVGGGFILVPALVLALSLPLPVAVGTSLLVIVVNSATALATRTALAPGDIDWGPIAGFTAVAVLGSLVGARLAGRIPARTQSITFAVLLVTVAVITAISAV